MDPSPLDTARLRHEIRAIYARVATAPSSEFHFHRGPRHPAERLRYDSVALAALSSEATASFAVGVLNRRRSVARKYGVRGVDVHALKS